MRAPNELFLAPRNRRQRALMETNVPCCERRQDLLALLPPYRESCPVSGVYLCRKRKFQGSEIFLAPRIETPHRRMDCKFNFINDEIIRLRTTV